MRPWVKYSLIGSLVVIVVGSAFAYRQFGPLINTGTGLVAHQVCNCLHVSNRELQACLDDRWPDMQTVPAEPIEINGQPAVRATSVISTRTATYEEGFGCTLQD